MKRVATAVFVVGAGTVAVWLAANQPAQALPPAAFERWYFSDPNFENQVGARTLECNGSRSGWGTTTAYSKVEWTEGCGSPGSWSRKCWTYQSVLGQFTQVQCIDVPAFPPGR